MRAAIKVIFGMHNLLIAQWIGPFIIYIICFINHCIIQNYHKTVFIQAIALISKLFGGISEDVSSSRIIVGSGRVPSFLLKLFFKSVEVSSIALRGYVDGEGMILFATLKIKLFLTCGKSDQYVVR